MKKEYPVHLTPEQKRAILESEPRISEDLAEYQKDLDDIDEDLEEHED